MTDRPQEKVAKLREKFQKAKAEQEMRIKASMKVYSECNSCPYERQPADAKRGQAQAASQLGVRRPQLEEGEDSLCMKGHSRTTP
jgi:hypothetical protein